MRTVTTLTAFLLPVLLWAGPINIASTGTATQSSTYPDIGGVPADLGAQLAIDGNTDGNLYNRSVTHTLSESQPWWQVQFTQASVITGIVLWNRTDCCGNRLTNFTVGVWSGTTLAWSSAYFTSGGYPDPSFSITLPGGTVGDRIRVNLNGTDYLSLAEVQVYADTSTPEPGTAALSAIALAAGGLFCGRRWWGGPPGPRGTPSSRCRKPS